MIIFKKIRWKNFLSTGNVFSEVDLRTSKTNLIIGSNGAGKSTILDALTFSLFGKPFRKINKPMLVNSINEKNCLTEIEFSIGKKEYKLVRGVKPNIFEIYCNGELWNQESSLVEQQKNFENNVLKMNYKSFTQIVVLGSSTFVPFMRLPLAQRREIIEDILDIQVFSTMNILLRDKVRENNEDIKTIDYEIHLLTEKIDLQKKYMLELEKKTKEEITRKENKIAELLGDENTQHQEIARLTSEVEKHSKEMEAVSTSTSKLKKLNTFLIKVQGKLKTCKKEHEFFEKNHVCPTCTQELSEEFRDEKLESGKTKVDEMLVGYNDILSAIGEEEVKFNKFTELSSQVMSINNSISQSNFQITSLRKTISDIESEIKELEGSNPDKKAEFVKLEGLVRNKKQLGGTLAENRKDRDTLLVASQLLKDNGIKTRIIKTYLPAMNQLINQYLQSMDFYVNFTLNENFEEIIKSRYRDVFSYDSFSEGEKSRIDIALLLTWRSIAKLKNSVDTNLLILDEIFDSSLDQQGGMDLSWILRNFDDNSNIYVISHRENLDGKFERTITAEKEKNFSVIRETVSELD
ncbi:SbcC-like subunit of palindrome specific endonuclease [Synechococcus phage ACG-2014e]|uniref:Gpre46 combination endonuclease n=1 Tax=Synechococcus phage ACG-2014e TaxID=1493510 RepID=A0A0E3FM61_9CAUD|nr:SbcC-like subunit of palindrome specific endonuclease [Synechococcus phage ACG-2014e]YP_010355739.1 SbcC-like subunit of palindrome specific endonuclease [Synechococcus phage ACG-2014e]AIX20590.1 gpre46 combination endonuclease [Synechococcus phage ACG-2014e]AIX29805.1 gpre46 combination endonuclease [Synechococcus phage ACG-2014e]AIX45043.1 gpre46 combination endonuclease [Synechococcus phage ACG-2014e]